jgi:hypothetical protein
MFYQLRLQFDTDPGSSCAERSLRGCATFSGVRPMYIMMACIPQWESKEMGNEKTNRDGMGHMYY